MTYNHTQFPICILSIMGAEVGSAATHYHNPWLSKCWYFKLLVRSHTLEVVPLAEWEAWDEVEILPYNGRSNRAFETQGGMDAIAKPVFPWVCQQFFPADIFLNHSENCATCILSRVSLPVNAILRQPVQILFHLEHGGWWAVLTCFSDICNNSSAIPFALILAIYNQNADVLLC